MTNTKLNEGGIASIFTSAAIVIALVLVISAAWYFPTSEKTSEASDNTGIVVRHLALSETGEPNVGIGIGQTAPNFIDANDNTFSLTGHRGNIVVLDMMATRCGPCITEMGHLKELFTNYSDRGVMIMSIDVDPSESDETIKQFAAKYGGNWVFASGPSVGVTYSVIYIPTLYIIDQQGRITYKKVEVTTYSTLADEIDKLL